MLDEDALEVQEPCTATSVVWVCGLRVPETYPDVQPFPAITEVQVVEPATLHLGTDRLARPSPDRVRVTLHGARTLSSPLVWEWLAGCCPYAEVTCVLGVTPGTPPNVSRECALALCEAPQGSPLVRTLVLGDGGGHPHLLENGPWEAPWLLLLRHLCLDTRSLGDGLASLAPDLRGLLTVDWRAHAHDVPCWPATTARHLALGSLQRLALTDHELPCISALNACPRLQHVVLAGCYRLRVDADQLRLPSLVSLSLVDTYQREPEALFTDLFRACSSLQALSVSQTTSHLDRVLSVRPHLRDCPGDTYVRDVLPTLQFADAVDKALTLPTALSPVQTVLVRSGKAFRKYLLPTSLVFRARRVAGACKVSAWPRSVFQAHRPRSSLRTLPANGA